MNLCCALPYLILPDFISDFPFYEYYVMISRYMIIMPYLFIPTLAYLFPEYFLPDITRYMHYCAHPVSPLGFASTLAWGVSFDSPGSSRPGLGAWSDWIFLVPDQSGAAVAWISSRPSRATSFQTPCVPLEFLFSKLVSALLYFSYLYFFVYLYASPLFILFIHVYSLYSRICAYL